MTKKIFTIFLCAISLLAITHCSKSTTFVTDKVADYYPLEVGKQYVYRLDSAIYTNFGQTKEVHTSYIKDIVDAIITDNLGRPSYRIRRLIQNKDDSSKWEEFSVYASTILSNSVEVNEDNLRIIKLQEPVKEFFSWNGNRYLPEDPFFPKYEFGSSDHRDLGSWDYYYDTVEGTETLEGKTYENVITVKGSDANSNNIPAVDLDVTGSRTFWMEKYAKGVGLIYKEVSIEEFQARNSIYPNGYYSGFEIKQTLVENY